MMTNVGKDVEKRKPLNTTGGHTISKVLTENSMEMSLKVKTRTIMIQLCIYSKKTKLGYWRGICILMLITALVTKRYRINLGVSTH
jgi:hypothetical protein